MDVTKENFEELLPEVIDDINSSSFLAVDSELTGLWDNNEPNHLDLPEDYYNKFISHASKFLCIQFGLSIFKINSSTKRYKVKSYKFNLFPHQFYQKSSYMFLCQASSIDFLSSNSFDFNKSFREGISFLNLEKEAELSEILQEKRLYKEKNVGREIEKIEVPEDMKACVDETCEKLGRVLNSDLDEDEVKIPGLNGYVRRLIYQTIKERYPNGELIVETRDGCMVSRKSNGKEQDKKTQLQLDEETISKFVGFSKVVRAMAKSGKLIIGHNMFLDMCHIINHFLCDLPETYEEFKGLMRGSFPLLIDTKYMSSHEGMQDLISVNCLNSLYQRVSQSPFNFPDIDVADGHSYELDKYHDAGFDSFITGQAFLAMYNYIAKAKNSSENPDFNPKAVVLQKFMNRLFLNGSDCHLYVSGEDPEPDRNHYFHVSFPKQWVMSDIIKIFSNHGRVNVKWINDTSAWVGLYNTENADACKSKLCSKQSHLPRGVKVTPYSVYIASVKKLNMDSRKRQPDESSPHNSPQPKKWRPSQEITSSSRRSKDMADNNVQSRNESSTKERSRSELSRTEENESPKCKRSTSEGNGVHPRKSRGGPRSAIETLEKDLDADTSSLNSMFGSSPW